MNERRERYLQHLAASAPPGSHVWIEAAADFLAIGDNGHRFYDRVLSILGDQRMRDFWSRADKAFAAHNHEQRERDTHYGSRGYSFNFDRYRRTIIMLMAFQGGPIPSEPIGRIKVRRRKLAANARRLAKGLAHEPALPSAFNRPLCEQLLTLADRLENGAPLCAFDPIDRAPWMPQPGRNSAQQLLIERRLCDEFRAWTGAPQHSLVATAVEVSLNVETDAESVRKREKLYWKSRPGG